MSFLKSYKDYLDYHVSKVQSAFFNILYPVLADEGINEGVLQEIIYNLERHDRSKYINPEYEPYSRHFIDPKGFPKTSPEYVHAWNHHQKSNPHHWQYWVLLNDIDVPIINPIDMPLQYIIEMLCDWQAASQYYSEGKLTAYDWYISQKDNMHLSSNTRELVEKYIEVFREER